MNRSSGRALVAGVTASAGGAIVLACIVSACSATGAVPDPEAQTAATPQRAAVITPAVATWADPTHVTCGSSAPDVVCVIGACTPAAAWAFDLPLRPVPAVSVSDVVVTV